MREYQRRLSVFESVPGTGSIVSIVNRMQLDKWVIVHFFHEPLAQEIGRPLPTFMTQNKFT